MFQANQALWRTFMNSCMWALDTSATIDEDFKCATQNNGDAENRDDLRNCAKQINNLKYRDQEVYGLEEAVKGMNPAPHIHEHLRYTIMATALRTPSRITTSRLSTLR